MKKVLLTIGRIVLRLIPLILIVLSLCCFDINEWAAIGVSAVWTILVEIIEYLFRSRHRKAVRAGKGHTAFIILDILVFLLMVAAAEFNPYWNSSTYRSTDQKQNGTVILTRKEALRDLDYAVKYLKKIHPLTLNGLPAEAEVKEKEVRSRLESLDTIEGYELAREIESIFSLLRDGHTYVEESYDGYHIMKHIYEHNRLDHTLVGINGERFEDYLVSHPGLCSYETTAYGIRMLKNRIVNLEGLKYLGVDISGDIVYNYETAEGREVTETVRAEDFLLMDEYLAYEEAVTGDDLHSSENRDFVYYVIDKEHSLAVLTLNSCRYNGFYKETVRNLFKEVEEGGIRNIAVDLRTNGGGSSMVADEFISYLSVDSYRDWADELRINPFLIRHSGSDVKNKKKGDGFSGNVYILTGVRTYSSAMDFAMMIKDNDLGTLIGEPCGNLPASYGEVVSFRLPESGLYMQVSVKKWHRVDESKEGEPLMPDIECPEARALEVLLNTISGSEEN